MAAPNRGQTVLVGLRQRTKQVRRAAWDTVFRRRVGAATVSIISNNCWGGFVSRRLRRPYASPFVGLFLMPDCYLTMLEHLDEHLESPLEFVAESKYPSAEEARRRQGRYPIGRLAGTAELHFLHAPDKAAARAAWERRLGRLDRTSPAVKLCDRDGCTMAHLQRFDRLPFPKKVAFTAVPRPEIACAVHIPGYEHQGQMPIDLADVADRHFDVAHWLRTGTHQSTPLIWRVVHQVT